MNQAAAGAGDFKRDGKTGFGDKMTGEQSRLLKVGNRICWQRDQADQGTVTGTNWAGLTVKWDNHSEQAIQHNDMAQVERVSTNLS